MSIDIEWIISRTPVADADRRAHSSELDPAKAERIAELRRRVREGAYSSAAMMEVVARRILTSGDL